MQEQRNDFRAESLDQRFVKSFRLVALKDLTSLPLIFQIDGDRDEEEIFYELTTIFDRMFYSADGQQPANGVYFASIPRA